MLNAAIFLTVIFYFNIFDIVKRKREREREREKERKKEKKKEKKR